MWGWKVMSNPVELIPLNDLRPHDENGNCWCKPYDDDGVLTHKAMDGREAYETGERKS